MQGALDRLLDDAPGVWGVMIRRVSDGRILAAANGAAPLRSASMAKVSLLVAVSQKVESGDLRLEQPVRRDSVEPVHDSGLWQHLRQDELPLDDVAKLVGTVSDNWATNALIAAVGGIGAAAHGAPSLGIADVRLLDIVRDERAPEHPPTLSIGTAEGYSQLFATLWRQRDPACARVLGWLADGSDPSMVAGAFGLDPLAHALPDRGITVISKTGTDDGVRGDAGLVIRGDDAIAYACIANWQPSSPADLDRDAVLATMRAIGELIRATPSNTT